jgi:hypothetical protein
MQDLVTHGLKLNKIHQHRARERFVASLRAYVLMDLAGKLRADYEQQVVPEGVTSSIFTAACAAPPRNWSGTRLLTTSRDSHPYCSSVSTN